MKKETIKNTIGILVLALFFFIFPRVISPWSTVTPMGVTVICVFAGCIAGILILHDMMLSSMLAMVALVINGIYTSSEVIAAFMGSSIVWQLITLFSLSAVMIQTGTGETLARFFLTRKFLQGRPLLMLFIMMLAFAVASVFMSPFATLLLAFPVLKGICDDLGIDVNKSFAQFLYLGVFVAICTGTKMMGMMEATTVSLVSYFVDATGQTPNNALIMLHGVVLVVAFIVLFLIFMRVAYPSQIAALKACDLRALLGNRNTKLSKTQTVQLVAFALIGLYSVVSEFLPTDIVFFAYLKKLGIVIFGTLVLAILSLVKVNGERVYDPAKAFQDGVNWPVVLAIGALSTIGGLVVSDAAGVKTWLSSCLANQFAGFGIVGYLLFAIIVTMILTNFMSNSATQYIMCGVLAAISLPLAEAGYNVFALPMAITNSAQVAFLTIAASGQAAILYTEKNMTTKFIWTRGLLMLLIWAVSATLSSLLFV